MTSMTSMMSTDRGTHVRIGNVRMDGVNLESRVRSLAANKAQ